MSSFLDSFPNSQAVLDLDVEDLAGLLIEFFRGLDWKAREAVMRTSFIVGEDMVPPRDKRYEVQRAIIGHGTGSSAKDLLSHGRMANTTSSFSLDGESR